MQARHKEFLNGREGSSDSDVDALMRKFDLSEKEAGAVFNLWLDSLSDPTQNPTAPE